MSESRHSETRSFNENSPRPPVPGEETGGYYSRPRPQSPALTPRRSSLATSKSSQDCCDASAPLGFEPEGCCDTTTMGSNTPPACLQWARNFQYLLTDEEGLRLFTRYLDQEGEPIARPLYFWFACQGLKGAQDPATIQHLVKAIHKRFFVKSQLAIDEDVKKEAHRRVMEGRADDKVFEAVQTEVERVMAETTYPNFLQSDMYLQYVQSCQNPDSGGCPSSSSSREMSLSCGPALLPTLHEDSEFVVSVRSSHSAGETPVESRSELRLTKNVLRATQMARILDIRPESEAFAGDGMSIGERRSSKKHSMRKCRAIPEEAIIPDPMPERYVIPRTQRISREAMQSQPPMAFAQVLTTKLESLQRERESQEKLERHLQETAAKSIEEASIATAKALSDALREKFLLEDDSDQAILDQHVSRVWSDPTPSRSPELASPRPHSPDRRQPTTSSSHSYMRQLKQRKDVVSTFSVDSGNIQDFADGSDFMGAGSVSSFGSHLPKSKSVPSDHADSLHKQDLYLQGHEQRLRRSDVLRRSATKKSMTELTDSGVSVVSYTPPVATCKDARLQARISQCDKKLDVKHGSSRHGKSTRSGSLERTSREKSGICIHPFVADPGMPPLPPPEPATQLDEAKRRLEEEERARAGSRQRHASMAKQIHMEAGMQSQATNLTKFAAQSNQSTLRKSRQDVGDFTTAVFTFCDEPLAYRTKIPGRNVTLKQFKEYLPKKGNYRFFFKTECEDLEMKEIQEEITDDAEVLPLWEGKVMAKVKAPE
ncbi:axin isoform X2 [Venturia canescens]|uniref:axin isoform X2 n=1 Tax=Venturia canescens TaxID=32260 RepID=UPI001C9C9DD1|nr:axin isoform X2 [Venturia canescens]